MSSSVYAGRTDQDRSSKRRRNDTEPEIKVMRITCPPRPAFDEWTPFLEEVARTEGLQELLEFNKSLPEAMLSRESHTRDKCKYLNEKPPEKGGPNKCAICYGEHWLTRCLYQNSVPQGLQVGPCYIILCKRCGKDIDNTLFCPCCKGTVPGRVGRRVCDCCGEDMLSVCRCHFLSSDSGDFVLPSNSGDSAVRPSIDRRRFKGNSGRGNRPQNFQSLVQAFTPSYAQYSYPNYSRPDFELDFWHGRLPDHFGCPACMTPLHGPTQCPLRFLFAGTRTQLLDSGHPFWYPDPAGVYVGRTEE